MNRFQLALRLLWQDGRSGELSILILALVIAVSSSTAISLFADRLHRTMNVQAAEFLAADLVIASPAPIAEIWHAKAEQLALKQAQTTEFPSVLLEHEQLLLGSVKAVSDLYPLRGQLKIRGADFNAEQIAAQPPQAGEVWVEARVLSALQLKLGDMLNVGEKALRISQIISYEPDKRGDLYSLSPRVLLNQADLGATNVIQPGSHIHYYFQFVGDSQNIAEFKHWLKPQLSPSKRVMDIHEDRPELGDALTRAERYLGLSSIVIILIAGVAIAMATRRYSERHFNATAMLRCLGCKQREILQLYVYQFIVLGTLASGFGSVLGWFMQLALFELLAKLLPAKIVAPSALALMFGFITGFAVLIGFALPPLLRLRKVPALRVLRRELEPLPTSAWLVYGLALALISILIWRYTTDLKLTVTLLGGGLIALTVMGGLCYWLLLQSRKLLPKLNLSWRFGAQALLRNPQATVSQILAFSLTLVAILLSFSVRNDLVRDWQQQLPENAPNHFALNIFPEQVDAFKQDLAALQIHSNYLYPIVKGRLVKINDTAVQQLVSKDSQGERATQRDLSLTWSATLPEDNQLSAGQWWNTENPEKNLVSIEEKLAKSLNVNLGDVLTFTLGSEQLSAKVANIRSLRWDTMKPNFYMIFPPTALDNYPSTYLTSFYLPTAEKHKLNTLVKKYPSITVLEVDLILNQLKSILTQLTQAINYLLYFALLAGFAVLFATVYASLDQRIYEAALMRTLGANRTLLRKIQLLEFSLLGLIAGLLAIIMSQALLWALYQFVLHLAYNPNWLLWLCTPLASVLCIMAAGYFGVYKVLDKPPMLILRQ